MPTTSGLITRSTVKEKVGLNHFIAVFSYGGMPPELAEKNMRLFAAEVMPVLQREGVAVSAPASAQVAVK